jgi:Skp family chaperone for outer membrane proteins
VPWAGNLEDEENGTVKKRTVGILAAVAALGVVVYLGTRLWAQPVQLPAPPGGAAAPRTRVCLINLSQVVQKYQKYLNYQNSVKAERDEAQRQLEAQRKQLAAWAAEHDQPQTPAARKEQLAHDIKASERQLKDYTDEYNEKHAKAELDLMVAIYKDIQDLLKRYAVARDIDLILQYNDMITPADFYNPTIFRSKLMNQALMPMVMASGIDITDEVARLLNQQFAPNGAH